MTSVAIDRRANKRDRFMKVRSEERPERVLGVRGRGFGSLRTIRRARAGPVSRRITRPCDPRPAARTLAGTPRADGLAP